MIASVRCDVSDVRAASYDPAVVRDALVRVLAPFGGMPAVVRAGDRVLLKPNLLRAARPHRAATTHPAVVEAVARAVIDAGARPVIGDSPAGAVQGIARVHERTGMRDVAERLRVPLVCFEDAGAVARRVDGRTYVIARAVLDADVVINLSKLKTHTLTAMTGPLKNCYGAMPGFAKGTFHTRYPRPRDFVEVLLDVASLVAPALTIVDAIACMEGEGPSSGRPVFRGRLLAGRDMVAVEHAAAAVLGTAAADMPLLRAARTRGLLAGEPSVEREGAHAHPSLASSSYWAARHIPRVSALLLQRALWVRARIDPRRCTRCGACVDACPVQAVQTTGPGAPPRVSRDRCIGCLVCVSTCADAAIDVHPSPIARWIV